MHPAIIVLIVVAILAIAIIAWAISVRNKFVLLINKVDEGFATIDVYLKKRYDLIPNLLETVKGYMKHEKETFESVIKARSYAMNAPADHKADAENALSGTLKTLFALSENYPQLKADTQFTQLQNELKVVENDLAQARKYYNAVIKSFNTTIQIFPSNIIAKRMKLEKKAYFELDSAEERKNVKILFH